MDLPVSRRLKIFFSSLLLQASWSFAGLQSLGFIHSLVSGSEKLNIKRHCDCFNTHPYMANFIIGAVLAVEEKGREILAEHLRRLKSALESAFASVGDLFFWNILRPTLALIGVGLTLRFGIVGPIFFLLIFNLIHIYTRIKGISVGYQKGPAVIEILKTPYLWRVIHLVEVVGLFATGFLFGIFLPMENLNRTIIMIIISLAAVLYLFHRKSLSSLFAILIIFIVIMGVL